jgi:hypothetical protein
MARRAKTELGIVLKPEVEFVGNFSIDEKS